MSITASGTPGFGSVATFLTADGIPVFRIGTSTNGLTAYGEPVFGLPPLSAAFNVAWNVAANTVIQPGATQG